MANPLSFQHFYGLKYQSGGHEMDAKGYESTKREILHVGRVSKMCKLFLEACRPAVAWLDCRFCEEQPLSMAGTRHWFITHLMSTTWWPSQFAPAPTSTLTITNLLFCFVLDLNLHQPFCSFVSLYCSVVCFAALDAEERAEMSHVAVEWLTSFTTQGGPTSPACTVLWTPERTASCQQNQ